jgi:predicted AAA+ superfamily ATPase
MLPRRLAGEIQVALKDTPVLFLNGARQTGKSTIAQELICPDGQPMRYLTLDDAPVLAAAEADPSGFVAGLGGPAVLDEVQRAPKLFLAIKAAVDRKRQPGQFLLTGSADVLLLPNISESLAGRMEIFTLWPLSQGEMEGTRDNLLDALFAKGPIKPYRGKEDRPASIERVTRGGYPIVQQRAADARRRAWFAGYLTTILQRDIRDLANIDDLTSMPRLIELLATRICGLLSFADISRSIGIAQTTLKRYFTLIETTFLVQTLPAWSANLGLRLVKAPKLYLNDTGLASYLLGLNAAQLAADPMALGPLLENFVLMELRKQSGWSGVRPNFYHFRTHAGNEVDIVLEDAAGNLVGVEVKASASVGAADVKGLRALAELTGSRFRRGIVFYLGADTVPFAKNIHAMPVESIWKA